VTGQTNPELGPAGFWPTARRLIGLLRPVRWRMAAVVAATCGFAGLNVAAPKFLGDATDVVVAGVYTGVLDTGKLAGLLATVALMYVGASLFSWVQGSLAATAVQRLVYGLRESLQAKLHRLPATHFQEQARGDLLSRCSNDVDNISQALNQLLNQLIVALLMLFGALAMMVWISPLLALIALVTVPLSTIVTILAARKSHAHFAEQWATTGDVNVHIEEFVTGHEVVKAFGRQPMAMARFSASNDRLFHASARAQYVSGVVQPLMIFVSNINYVAVAVVGALQVTAGAMTIGGVQAFIQFSRLFSQPLGQIGGMLTLMQSCAASAARVFALLDSEETPAERPGPAAPAGPRGRIAFEDVTFGYGNGTPAVSDVSFAVEPGQTVAIVGPTGAGKTTLVNLLLRFYDPDAGRITLDGVDVADIPRDVLRSAFAVVLQDTWLFSGSVRENIEYGRPGASEEALAAAAEASHVHHFIRALPAGYATALGNDGDSLSEGQRQLLGIARAQLAGGSILVLDEATSSVDSRTEILIRQAMQRIRKGRTSLVIAHRLSTVRDADLILVMDHGRIIERGTHAQLLALGGTYAGLYEAQFDGVRRLRAPRETGL
jgi:ATP-binding cassette, subfamily B, multidrug efflux pump